mgnify:CR=1 FL=1
MTLFSVYLFQDKTPIYPKYPKYPKYYLFVYSSPPKQPIRITNSISFDYTDSPYHLLTLSSPSCGHILIPPQKVRRNSFLRVFSIKINAPFLIPPFRHMLFLYFMYGFYGLPFSEGIPNPYRRSA